jgi:hypothetical protein
MHNLNCLLPPARYSTGGGVAALLCGAAAGEGGGGTLQRRSMSVPELAGEGASGSSAPAEGPGGEQQRQTGISGSLLALDAAERPQLRRRSVMVGNLLFRLQQEQEGQQPPGQDHEQQGEQQQQQAPLPPEDGFNEGASLPGSTTGDGRGSGVAGGSLPGADGSSREAAEAGLSRHSVSIAEVMQGKGLKTQVRWWTPSLEAGSRLAVPH